MKDRAAYAGSGAKAGKALSPGQDDQDIQVVLDPVIRLRIGSADGVRFPCHRAGHDQRRSGPAGSPDKAEDAGAGAPSRRLSEPGPDYGAGGNLSLIHI